MAIFNSYVSLAEGIWEGWGFTNFHMETLQQDPALEKRPHDPYM